jgi:hypothetical protein
MAERIEYRVRPVTRYIITRYEETGQGEGRSAAACGTRGEYDNADTAYEVGYALARADAERLGCDPGDMRVIYPEHPDRENAQRSP